MSFTTGCASDSAPLCQPEIWYRDSDSDGLGDADHSATQCEQPAGFVNNKDDNDDTVPGTGSNNISLRVNPGAHQAFLLGETTAPYGFYLYTPSSYGAIDETRHSLLIHLHGGGARGNSKSNPQDLDKILYDGPPLLISNNQWAPNHDMIVASPQSPNQWNTDQLHHFISYLISQLSIDTHRIYLTGFSMGARGCFDYVTAKGDEGYAVAIVPIAGWGNSTLSHQFENIPVWAFHGDADNIVSVNSSINMVTSINNNEPATRAKLTIFPGVDHFSWPRTYDGSGKGDESPDYDPFDMDIYEWMHLFEKP